MYSVVVRYSKAGLIAHDLSGDTLKIAVAKALNFKSQGFHVEVKDPDGNDVTFTNVK